MTDPTTPDMTAPEEGGPVTITPLVADILTVMISDSADVNQRLIASLTTQVDEYRAELGLIRNRVEVLLSGPYMPTPAALIGALWPGQAAVEAAAERERNCPR